MDLPAVAVVDVRKSGGDAAFGHHGVRLAEKRLAHQTDPHTRRRRLDRGAQAGAARSDDEHIVLVGLVRQRILQSVRRPIEQRRT